MTHQINVIDNKWTHGQEIELSVGVDTSDESAAQRAIELGRTVKSVRGLTTIVIAMSDRSVLAVIG